MLLSELNFWTSDGPSFGIKESPDLAVHNYVGDGSGSTAGGSGGGSSKHDKKHKDAHVVGKELYCTKRGVKLQLDNKKPHRLKRNMKKLETELRSQSIVHCEWIFSNIVQIMLSNGLLAYIVINSLTSDLVHIGFDKFFIGKLVSTAVHNVIISKMHILISYNENQITFVYLQKPNLQRRANPDKIQNMDPKIFHFVIGGTQRKLPRNLACNISCDLLAVWTKGSQAEVYPWRPSNKDQERANLHVYKLSRTKLELLAYYWTEHDPICVEFSKQQENQLHSIEQKISRKGIVTVESCLYQLNRSKIQRVSVTSIPLQTQVCCCKFSPDHEKIVLGCIDGSIVLLDTGRSITHLVKAAFIPTLISWHCDAAILMIGNERCQLQCFDISLSCVKNQLLSEDLAPSSVFDLSVCFSTQTNLFKLCFSKKPDALTHYEKYIQEDSHLLLAFENGLLGCVRLVGGAGLKNDIHKTGITADVLVHYYIDNNHVEKAINVLLSLNWDAYGAMCLVSLHKIANFIFKKPLTSERELQLQKALGSFHIPVKPLCNETTKEFGDQVDDITRRFFHYMIRYESFEKAFSLAIDINDADLFMDLYRVTRSKGITDLAQDAVKKAEEIYKQIEEDEANSNGSHSTCSHSSCSICFSDDDENSEIDNRQRPRDGGDAVTESDGDSRTEVDQGQIAKLFKSNSAELLNNRLPGSAVTKTLERFTALPKQYIPPLPHVARSTTAQKVHINKPTMSMSNLRIGSSGAAGGIGDFNKDKPSYSMDNLNANVFSSGLQTRDDSVLNILPTPMKAPHLSPAATPPGIKRYDPIDQTLGIPLTTAPPPPYPKPYFQSPYASYPMDYTPYRPVFASAPPIFHNHPLVAGKIPSMIAPPMTSLPTTINQQPPASILSTKMPSSEQSSSSALKTSPKKEFNSILTNTSANSSNKKESGEKNKVKFSDTVQIAVVPEVSRKDHGQRTMVSMERIRKGPFMDPEKELAESLPLCHPDDYLKDFNPMPPDQQNHQNESGGKEKDKKSGSAVKVVHFGLV